MKYKSLAAWSTGVSVALFCVLIALLEIDVELPDVVWIFLVLTLAITFAVALAAAILSVGGRSGRE